MAFPATSQRGASHARCWQCWPRGRSCRPMLIATGWGDTPGAGVARRNLQQVHPATARRAEHRLLRSAQQLAIRLHDEPEHATVTIRLPADHLPHITETAEAIGDRTQWPAQTPAPGDRWCGFVRAPDRIRTDTVTLLRRLPLPFGLRGPPPGAVEQSVDGDGGPVG